MRRLIIIKMSVLFKLIYKINVIQIKIPVCQSQYWQTES